MNKSLVRESTVYGVGILLTRALGFLLIPLYTRYLSVADYGALALLTLMLQGINFVCLSGISSAATRLYFTRQTSDQDRRRLYGNATLLLLIFPPAVLLVLGPVFWYGVTAYLSSIPFLPYVLSVLLMGLFTPMIALMSGLLNVQRRPGSFVAFHLSYFAVQAVTIVVAVAFLGYGLRGQIYAQLMTASIFGFLALAILLRYTRPTYSPTLVKTMLAFGLPLVPFFVFAWIDSGAGRFAIEKFYNLETVGVFSLASQFAGLLTLVSSSVDNALLPHFLVRANEPDSRAELGSLVVRYIAFFSLLGLIIVVGAPPAILLIGTPDYYDAINYVPPLIVANLLYVLRQPIFWSLSHSHRTGVLSAVNGLSSILLVGLLIVFLGWWNLGITGVAYAMIVVNLVAIALGTTYAQRHFSVLLPWRRLSVVIALVGTSGAFMCLFSSERLSIPLLAGQFIVVAVVAFTTLRLVGIRNPLRLISVKRE